jgi:uncharacterized protein
MSFDPSLEARFRGFVANPAFPCVGAKAALQKQQFVFHRARSIASAWDDLAIAEELIAFAGAQRRRPTLFTSFVLLFEGPRTLSEAQFERALWDRLQSLSDKDAWLGQRVAPAISAEPESPHFALSFGGQAFFAVGLHPHASRRARRFAAPAIVFNLHSQFAKLRATGRYEKMRATILERDSRLQGSINPMLARHGSVSEARQYSGRAVDADWQCPFHPRRHAHDPLDLHPPEIPGIGGDTARIGDGAAAGGRSAAAGDRP